MPKREVYHVTKHEEGWQVKKEKGQRASSVHATKEEAVARGKDLAKAAQQGQIKIHKSDGTIQTEHTYKNDPRRSKG